MRKTSYRNLIPRTVSDAARSAFLCRCRFKTVFRSFRNFYAFRSSAFSTFLRAFDAWKKNEFLDSATRRSLSPRDISPAPSVITRRSPAPLIALIRFPARFRVTPMARPFFAASLTRDRTSSQSFSSPYGRYWNEQDFPPTALLRRSRYL